MVAPLFAWDLNETAPVTTRRQHRTSCPASLVKLVQGQGDSTGGLPESPTSFHRADDGSRVRSAFFGLCLAKLADVRVAQLLAAVLGSCECFFGSLCDPIALVLGDGCVNVQHEGIHIGTYLGDNEGRPLHHQAADEMYVTTQSVELGDDDRCGTGLAEPSEVLEQL